MAQRTESTRALDHRELLVLGIAVNAGFVRKRPPGRDSTKVLEELVDAGLLRKMRGGYVPTQEGRQVAAVIPDG